MVPFVLEGDHIYTFYEFFLRISIFFKYFLAIETNLCIMPLFMQFYGGSPCPAAAVADLSSMGVGLPKTF